MHCWPFAAVTQTTPNGKALLAELSGERLLSLLPEHLAALTPNTTRGRRQLLEDFTEIRARGYASDREEHTEGICAVGAPSAMPTTPSLRSPSRSRPNDS